METLHFTFKGGTRPVDSNAQLVGVVSSGNLEVLVEPTPDSGTCVIDVNTSAHGFGEIWGAVMADFHARWQLANVRIAINDMGATPAVVSLRLDQAVESMLGEA